MPYDLTGGAVGQPTLYDLVMQRLSGAPPFNTPQPMAPARGNPMPADVGGTAPAAQPQPGGDPWTQVSAYQGVKPDASGMAMLRQMMENFDPIATARAAGYDKYTGNDDAYKGYSNAFPVPYKKGQPSPFLQAQNIGSTNQSVPMPSLWQKLLSVLGR